MNENKYDIVILGAGESGTGTALLAKAKGLRPFVSDFGPIADRFKQELNLAGVDFEENQHSKDLVLSVSEIVKSPGIPDKTALIREAIDQGIQVISEIEFAYRYFNGKIIAVTGSNGKTTTTSLIHHILKYCEFEVAVGGNIGRSFARIALDGKAKIAVLELSSFQLDGIVSFRPDVSVITNISPDHLDRYEYKMEKYVQSKFRIAMNQSDEDQLIYFNDQSYITTYLENHPLQVQAIPFQLAEGRVLEYALDEMKIKGPHNQLNAIASIMAVNRFVSVHRLIYEAIKLFEPIPHRLQKIAEIEGVEYINDSKATNTDAVFNALKSFEKPIVWIAGGVDKGNDYSELNDVTGNVKALICLGTDNSKLLTHYQNRLKVIKEANSMQSAIQQARELAVSGDIVLLSPACASFDLFKNYEDRGDQFVATVRSYDAVGLKLNEKK